MNRDEVAPGNRRHTNTGSALTAAPLLMPIFFPIGTSVFGVMTTNAGTTAMEAQVNTRDCLYFQGARQSGLTMKKDLAFHNEDLADNSPPEELCLWCILWIKMFAQFERNR